MEQISIGEFARRSRLSLKALRLYDKRGVLVPARVDRASGYRYYDTAQLDQAQAGLAAPQDGIDPVGIAVVGGQAAAGGVGLDPLGQRVTEREVIRA